MSSSPTDRLSAANPRRVLLEPTPVVGVRFADGRVYLAMEDGREIGAPIEHFPRLAKANDTQRPRWRRIGRGFGVHWPDIDEDLSVAHLLGLSD
jgi:Protein of unknown function (DUF2442)